MHYFWISINACCLLKSTAILVNKLVNKNSSTSCNLLNVIKCYLIIIHWLIKKASSIKRCNLLFLLRVLLYHPYSQTIKQKVYLLPEHVDQLSNLKINFFSIDTFDWYLLQVFFLKKRILVVTLSWNIIIFCLSAFCRRNNTVFRPS